MIERYWRVVYSSGPVDYILGLQMKNQDVPQYLVPYLRTLLSKAAAANAYELYENAAEAILKAVKDNFKDEDRYFFIEVGCDEDWWVQIYYPAPEFRKTASEFRKAA